MSNTPLAHILLLEDEQHLSMLLEFNLQQEGYTVTLATTLAEARQLVTSSAVFDLLLFDVMLPDGNAFELCQELRLEGVHTPLLFLTAKGSGEDIVTGLQLGGDDYMTKPFSLDELLARIAAMLRRKQWEDRPAPVTAEEITELTFAGNRINFVTHEVLARGKSVELTALELRLLKFFAEHANQVVTRKQILKEVWDVSPTIYTRTVDNFLVRLRRLFEKNPSAPQHFVTIRGVGYRFIPHP